MLCQYYKANEQISIFQYISFSYSDNSQCVEVNHGMIDGEDSSMKKLKVGPQDKTKEQIYGL